jgi:hypothetical protein
MSAGVVADSLLLVIAVAALGAAALRCAATLTDDPLARLIAAAALGAAVAVVEALGLGLFALGGSPGALSGLAVVTWVTVRWLIPAPSRPLHAEARTALGGAGLGELAGVGAVAGLLLGVALTELHRPVLGQDAVTYHLPEVIGFVQSGHTGRVLSDFYGLPVGNYPLTQEVLLAWATGISHGFGASILLTLATVPLLLLAGWFGLAELGVNRAVAALALAALALVPLVLEAWTQPGTDLEAFTWLVCCAALCLGARRDRGLLAAALVAGALGVGTKTTVVTWVVLTLAVTAWFQRGALRTHWRQLLAAAALAVVTGLTWYLRNWIDHGSPLWPFSSFPAGDPRPRLIDYLSTSLLDSFHRTLLDHLHAYTSALSGGVVLVLGGILCALVGLVLGRRRLILAGVVVLAGALEYAAGPVTGLPAGGLALVGVVGSTLRYLMPVFGAGAVALVLTASDENRVVAGLGAAGLLGTLVWDVVTDAGVRFDLPFDGWLIPAAVIGMLALPALALGLRGLPAHPWGLMRAMAAKVPTGANGQPRAGHAPQGPTPAAGWTVPGVLGLVTPAAVAVLTAALATAALAVGSTHFSYRNAATRDFGAPISAFLQTQPAYADTKLPVATSGTGLAQLAGDRLQHPLTVISEHARCATVAADRLRGWVVTEVTQPDTRTGVLSHVVQNGTADGCLSRVTPVFDDGQYAVYAPLSPPLRISEKVS